MCSRTDRFAREASEFWRKAFINKGAEDVLAGTGLQQMAEDLGFWCYILKEAFPKEVHKATPVSRSNPAPYTLSPKRPEP